MDPRGNIYEAPPDAIPAEDKERLHEQIRDWHAKLKAGGAAGSFQPGDPALPLVMATVRYLNGLGVDRSDPNGEQAMAEVRAALDPPAP